MQTTTPNEVLDSCELDSVLSIAEELVSGDRGNSYGPPWEDFVRTAKAWRAIFGWEVSPQQVASAMIILKLSRAQHSPKRDNWIDIAGYAHCGDLCDLAGAADHV